MGVVKVAEQNLVILATSKRFNLVTLALASGCGCGKIRPVRVRDQHFLRVSLDSKEGIYTWLAAVSQRYREFIRYFLSGFLEYKTLSQHISRNRMSWLSREWILATSAYGSSRIDIGDLLSPSATNSLNPSKASIGLDVRARSWTSPWPNQQTPRSSPRSSEWSEIQLGHMGVMY